MDNTKETTTKGKGGEVVTKVETVDYQTQPGGKTTEKPVEIVHTVVPNKGEAGADAPAKK